MIYADRRSLIEKISDLRWGGKDFPSYDGELSVGISKTQVTNPANIGAAGGGSFGLANSGLFQMWMAWNQGNGSTLTNDTVFVGGGLNLTASISSFGTQNRPGNNSDVGYTPFGMNAVGGGNAFLYASNGARSTNVVNGIGWKQIQVFSARAFPSNSSGPVNYNPAWFIGLNRGIGNATGLQTGLGFLTANMATESVWTNNNGGVSFIGFYFAPVARSNNWFAVSGTGSGTSTVVDTGILTSRTVTQMLAFTYNGANTVTFYIGGVKCATITSNLPAATDGMAHFAGTCVYGAVSPTARQDWAFSHMLAAM